MIMLGCRSSSVFCFFFFKQKTAYEMRISDWSSDVCSSDLKSVGGMTMFVSLCCALLCGRATKSCEFRARESVRLQVREADQAEVGGCARGHKSVGGDRKSVV